MDAIGGQDPAAVAYNARRWRVRWGVPVQPGRDDVTRGMNRMDYGYGYFYWILASLVLGYLMRNPWLLLPIGLVFAFRRYIPDPVILLRTMGRISGLKRQIDANPANVTARRDLAEIYLSQLRPGRAVALLEEALARFPEDAELLFLHGLALHRTNANDRAIASLVRAVEVDGRVRFGQPFLVAGDALMQLGRHEEALDAYERFLERSSSSIEGHVKRSRAHRASRDLEAASRDLEEARKTWKALPAYQRRAQLGWFVRVHWDRAFG